jgi:phage protein D
MAEAPIAERTLYIARPTVRVNEQAFALVSELLLGMRMTESEGGMSALELRLSNWASGTDGGADYAFEDDAILKLGAAIIIYVGEESAPQEIFRGKIIGIEADFPRDQAPELIVLAEDVFQEARMTRRTKVFDATTLARIAEEIAQNLSLQPVITGFTDDIDTQVQFNESDLAFLRRLLARYDGDLQVVGSEMHVSPRSEVQRGRVTLQLRSQLRAARALADLAHQVTEITASGWDVRSGETISASSTGANKGPGSGQDGAHHLGDAIDERSHHIGHLAARDQRELQALVDSAFDQRARRFVRVEGTAEGNGQIRVGTNLVLEGLGPRFSNTYYVTRTCHRYDLVNGYETDFEAECAYLGEG